MTTSLRYPWSPLYSSDMFFMEYATFALCALLTNLAPREPYTTLTMVGERELVK